MEDGLIDHVVALEALALPNRGTELSFQFRLVLSRYLASDPIRRKELFAEDLKLIYDVRSALVYGGSSSLSRERLREAAHLAKGHNPKRLAKGHD